jgi:hypothetical protein
LAQAQKKELSHERPLWSEVIKIEPTPRIVTTEVFQVEPVDIQDVPQEKQNKFFNLLSFSRVNGISWQNYQTQSPVMHGSRTQIGVDVFDTYSPVIDYSTVRLLISLALGIKWERFHWSISVHSQMLKLRKKLR